LSRRASCTAIAAGRPKPMPERPFDMKNVPGS
jgi:hypothetical protein